MSNSFHLEEEYGSFLDNLERYIPEVDDDPIQHFGVKGMKWGVRKDRSSSSGDSPAKRRLTPEQKAKMKKIAIGAGALLVAAGAIAVAHQLNKNGNVPVKSTGRMTDRTKSRGREATEKVLREPVDIIHASRGRSKGFSFLKNGGFDDSLLEYEAAFGSDSGQVGVFKRYGKNGEKIAASFLDPDGRRDFAGRVIPHEIIIPKSMTSGINNLDDVMTKIWPLLKDQYDAHYDG